MNRVSILLVILLVLLLAVGAGVWWYFFAPNAVAGAELVPADTFAYATLPNAIEIGAGYQGSHLKTLIDSSNVQPTIDSISNEIGQKNLDLIQSFLPNLSGQSFIAVTHVDVDHPDQMGFIAAMKPKPGLGNFDAFIQKLNTAYPDFVKEAKTGHDTVVGVDYQWIQGPDVPQKICVLQMGGWIVTTWGPASLQDWIERYQRKSSTPSLAENPDYKKSLERIGKGSLAILYVNYHAAMDLIAKHLTPIAPIQAQAFSKQASGMGGAAVGADFEDGDIVDHFSVLQTHDAQVQNGTADLKSSFDTLKFTGPDTRLYLGGCMNWAQLWKNFQAQSTPEMPNPVVNALQTWIQGANLDVQKNIIDPLGQEYSIQVDWGADDLYPSIGLFIKLDKPDDFRPTETAIVDTVRKLYGTAGTIDQVTSNGHTFAALTPLGGVPVNPTITQDGDYFGLFLTQSQAVRSFDRSPNSGLLNNGDFNHQIGDKRNGAVGMFYADTPQLLDRTYRTGLPYVSMAALMNPTIAGLIKGRNLPPDLTWLTPIGTWSFVTSMDNDGMTGYSKSGIGNQGILFTGALGAGFGLYSTFLHPSGMFSPGMTPVSPTLQPSAPFAPAVTTPISGAANPPDATTGTAGSVTIPASTSATTGQDTTVVPPSPSTNSDAPSTNSSSSEMH